MLLLDGVEAADAGADEHPDLVAVDLFQIETGIQQRVMPGGDAELGVTIRAAHILGRRKSGQGIEVFHLTRDLGVELGHIEERDAVDAALAREDVLPQVIHAAEGGDRTQAGDDHSAFV